MSDPVRVPVRLGARAYEIIVGSGPLKHAGELMAPLLARRRVHIVSDETVAALHLPSLISSLEESGISHGESVLPPGETTKDFRHLESLLDELLAARVERRDTIVALGGGVIGDLAGFAASVLRRGVDFIQMPTTLLAQVDSAIGGKTGINTRHGKNLVGSFHQPRLVLNDVDVLATLPPRERRAGYAEVVKYGLLGDAEFFAWLESHGRAACRGEPEALRHAVLRSCRMKARLVAEDEREEGQRALLNLGHTFAHALESSTGYVELNHGEAVSIGLVLAFELSVRLGHCPPGDAARVRRHLAAVGLPTSPPAALSRGGATRLVERMYQDKKVRDGRLAFVLARGIGDAFVTRDLDASDVAAVIEKELAA